MIRTKIHTKKIGKCDLLAQAASTAGHRISKTYKLYQKAVRSGKKSIIIPDKNADPKYRISRLPDGSFRVSVLYSNKCIACRIIVTWDYSQPDGFDIAGKVDAFLLRLQEFLRGNCNPHAFINSSLDDFYKSEGTVSRYGLVTVFALVLGATAREVHRFFQKSIEDGFACFVFDGSGAV